MAKICEGMSGREISKLGVSWQAAVYASEDGVLTEKMVLDKAEAAAAQHKQKVDLKQLKIKKFLLILYIFSQFLDGLVIRTGTSGSQIYYRWQRTIKSYQFPKTLVLVKKKTAGY